MGAVTAMTNNYTSYLDYVRVVVIRGLIHVQVRKLRWWLPVIRAWKTVKTYPSPGRGENLMLAKTWAEEFDRQLWRSKYGRDK